MVLPSFPMLANTERSHWSRVMRHFAADALLLLACFKVAVVLRFQSLADPHEWLYLPTVAVAAVFLPSVFYICGFYASEKLRRSVATEHVLRALALIATAVVVLSLGSLYFSGRLGRGVLALGMGLTAVAVTFRHVVLRRSFQASGGGTAFVVASEADDRMAETFARLEGDGGAFSGVFTMPGHLTRSGLKPLGCALNMAEVMEENGIRHVLCSEHLLHMPVIAGELRRIRYQGCTVSTLAQAFEDHFQMVPLELVSEHWLAYASTHPHMLYIRKLKRVFDLVVASGLLCLLSPVFLVAAVLVKLSSKGPVIYRQTRSGKGGHLFQVFKLRSMHVNAEADGKPRWWRKNDARETWIGRWLRKFRIDEIPQLVNILRGEMSFVGPRPERPEFVEELARQIPFYEERLMMPPGLTGWAQVNYPYGSTVDDAAQKLEFDLYYLKHMSLVLDLFILLDTVRTVLLGGALHRCPARAAMTELLEPAPFRGETAAQMPRAA